MSNKQTKKEKLMKILMSQEACSKGDSPILILDLVKEQLEDDLPNIPVVVDIYPITKNEEYRYSTVKCLEENDGERDMDMWSDETFGAIYYNIQNSIKYFTHDLHYLGLDGHLGKLEELGGRIYLNVLHEIERDDDELKELLMECIYKEEDLERPDLPPHFRKWCVEQFQAVEEGTLNDEQYHLFTEMIEERMDNTYVQECFNEHERRKEQKEKEEKEQKEKEETDTDTNDVIIKKEDWDKIKGVLWTGWDVNRSHWYEDLEKEEFEEIQKILEKKIFHNK